MNVPADVCADDLDDPGLTATELGSYDSDQLWSYEVACGRAGPLTGGPQRGGYRTTEPTCSRPSGFLRFPALVNAGKAKIVGSKPTCR